MSFKDLRQFIQHLERRGELVRIKAEVDPDQEVSVIQHRVIRQQGPALLFENVKGSSYRILTNMFGTRKRVDMVFGGSPSELGEKIFNLSQTLMPPSIKRLWGARKDILRLSSARIKKVNTGPVVKSVFPDVNLEKLPVLKCWPDDGGHFFTLPLVYTEDPTDGRGNLGMYRMQRFDRTSTGMHWQIERGGGFHFFKACNKGRSIPVSVILGGPPALVIAAVAPLPEGMDERLLAALLTGSPLEVIHRPHTGHTVPARAEFLLEGIVSPDERRMEGPFGDHFGHYSNAANYPVFRVRTISARPDAIYPATVVGKPIQEDYYIGEALQELTKPLLKMIRPGITDLWAYPETGFHPLAVMSTRERYPHEALKHVLGMLGEGQVSLTKVMIAVDADVNVKDFHAVSSALWRNMDPATGVHLLAPTAQDTLDFTGPRMNTGSRLILLAVGKGRKPVRSEIPPEPPEASQIDPCISRLGCIGPSFLIVQVKDGNFELERVRQALCAHPVTRQYLFHVLVSGDIPVNDRAMVLWGWFTRFDPLADIHPSRRRLTGNRLLFDFPILIDARWKDGYPEPVAFDPLVEKRVNERWGEYGLK